MGWFTTWVFVASRRVYCMVVSEVIIRVITKLGNKALPFHPLPKRSLFLLGVPYLFSTMSTPFPRIPQIITTNVSNVDLSSSPSSQPPSSNDLPSPDLLNPNQPPIRVSLDVPPSPAPTYASSNDGTTINAPPSPTLSNKSSVHFATSLNLRDNDVNRPTFSGLLSPVHSLSPNQHRRNRSWASSIGGTSSDGTEPDHAPPSPDVPLNPLRHVKTASSDNTRVNRSRSHSRVKSQSRESNDLKGKGREIADSQINTPLPNDLDCDPAPFAFKPYQLAQILDPKDLSLLDALGGIDGLLTGLGTHKSRGLTTIPSTRSSTSNPSSPRHKPPNEADPILPGIVVTAPEGDPDQIEPPTPIGPAFSAPLDERRRVYGRNILPLRKSQSLLQLMLATLKDKVLVRLFFFVATFNLRVIIAVIFRFCCHLLQWFPSPSVSFRISVREESRASLLWIGLKASPSWLLFSSS